MNYPVVPIDILKAVVSKMTVTDYPVIYFQAGRSIQIMKELNDLDNSITYKNKKYPLVAVILPIRERRGGEFYSELIIPRIVFATLSDATDDIPTRYETGGTFKKILYPMYYEFLNRLAQSASVNGMDPDKFEHTKMDNPGVQPAGEGSTDYIDSLEILNLEISLTQIKTC